MKITNPEAFLDAQLQSRIAFISYPSEMAHQYWAAAMKSLKEAYHA